MGKKKKKKQLDFTPEEKIFTPEEREDDLLYPKDTSKDSNRIIDTFVIIILLALIGAIWWSYDKGKEPIVPAPQPSVNVSPVSPNVIPPVNNDVIVPPNTPLEPVKPNGTIPGYNDKGQTVNVPAPTEQDYDNPDNSGHHLRWVTKDGVKHYFWRDDNGKRHWWPQER